MEIRIFITGGTFDKEYDEIHGKLFFTHTHINEILKLGRSQLNVKITELMLIDSLEMTAAMRRKILNACREAEENQIVITHGTDTMCETARVLAQARLNKTIVLTGAMIPYKFGTSDGLFNMGSALAFAQALPPNVYIAMNGRWFDWDRVRKNRESGIFEEFRLPESKEEKLHEN
ncbi:MAG: asparaginase [FCB group bacterium]|nr:asparaginase [FCB group bacterium]